MITYSQESACTKFWQPTEQSFDSAEKEKSLPNQERKTMHTTFIGIVWLHWPCKLHNWEHCIPRIIVIIHGYFQPENSCVFSGNQVDKSDTQFPAHVVNVNISHSTRSLFIAYFLCRSVILGIKIVFVVHCTLSMLFFHSTLIAQPSS